MADEPSDDELPGGPQDTNPVEWANYPAFSRSYGGMTATTSALTVVPRRRS